MDFDLAYSLEVESLVVAYGVWRMYMYVSLSGQPLAGRFALVPHRCRGNAFDRGNPEMHKAILASNWRR